MKRKYLIMISILILAINLIGCSKGEVKNANSSEATGTEIKKEEKKEIQKKSNTQTIDGLTLTANAKIEPVIGDRTADNYGEEKGEYFAIGSDIVKASDYKNIAVNLNVENNTDKSVKIDPYFIAASLQDGYELNKNIKFSEDDDQFQSKSSGEYKFGIIIKKDIKADKINIAYTWIKDEEEFKKLMQDPKVSKMSEEQVDKKYKDIFSQFNLEVDMQ